MIGTILTTLVYIGAIATVLVTVLPLVRSHRWWIRAMDFPRIQIAIAAALFVLLPAFFLDGWPRIVVVAAMALCLLYQVIRILPFTPLYPTELELAPDDQTVDFLNILSANVEMGNDRHAEMARLIDEVDPDILYLMETDAIWNDALKPQLDRYPTVVRELRDDFWGMIFATRLPVHRAEAVYLTPDDTPTLFAELSCPAGRIFRFVGLHPQPPVPGVDTEDRDAEILYASRFARKRNIPLVAVGDFNDAAWSDSTRKFKHVGGFLDPRVGRGLYASFDTRSRFLRLPIDQFFLTPEIVINDFHRGPDVGSDHFPLIIRMGTDPELAARLNKTPRKIDPTHLEEIERIVDAHRQKLGAEIYE